MTMVMIDDTYILYKYINFCNVSYFNVNFFGYQ